MTDWLTVSSAPDAVSYEEDDSPSAGENPQGDDIARAQETDPEMGRLVRICLGPSFYQSGLTIRTVLMPTDFFEA